MLKPQLRGPVSELAVPCFFLRIRGGGQRAPSASALETTNSPRLHRMRRQRSVPEVSSEPIFSTTATGLCLRRHAHSSTLLKLQRAPSLTSTLPLPWLLRWITLFLCCRVKGLTDSARHGQSDMTVSALQLQLQCQRRGQSYVKSVKRWVLAYVRASTLGRAGCTLEH